MFQLPPSAYLPPPSHPTGSLGLLSILLGPHSYMPTPHPTPGHALLFWKKKGSVPRCLLLCHPESGHHFGSSHNSREAWIAATPKMAPASGMGQTASIKGHIVHQLILSQKDYLWKVPFWKRISEQPYYTKTTSCHPGSRIHCSHSQNGVDGMRWLHSASADFLLDT